MEQVDVVGFDLAKQFFQVHGEDNKGVKLFSRKLRRAEVKAFFEALPRCTVAMEACGSAFHWARELQAMGHKAMILPSQYVKPFRRRGKTDAADAEAIATTARQASIRPVPIKTVDQQALTVLIKSRTLLTKQKKNVVNALRGHMAEFGIVSASSIAPLSAIILDENDSRLPAAARFALAAIYSQIDLLIRAIDELDGKIAALAKLDDDIERLMTIPGVGRVTACTLKAYVPDVSGFKSGRSFASWLGLTPRPNSSGGVMRNGGISKMGNRALRSLLVLGAIAVVRNARKSDAPLPWLKRLIERRPYRVAAVAVANKTARIIWALLSRGGLYRADGEEAPALTPA